MCVLPWKDCRTNVECPRHLSLLICLPGVSFCLSCFACPLVSPTPSLPPATVVPFNVANDCRSFFPSFSCYSSPASALPLLTLPLCPFSTSLLATNAFLYLSSCSLSTPRSRPSLKMGSAVRWGSDKMYIYVVWKRGKRKKKTQRKRRDGTCGATIVTRDNSGS